MNKRKRMSLAAVGEDLYSYFQSNHTDPDEFVHDDGKFGHLACLIAMQMTICAMLRAGGAEDTDIVQFYDSVVKMEQEIRSEHVKQTRH